MGSNSPFSLKSILAGILITVIGGVIVAYVIRDARFANTLAPGIPRLGSADVVVEPIEMAHFDDWTGVFSMDYPALIGGITEREQTSNMYEVAASRPDAVAGMFVRFRVLSDQPISEQQWQSELDSILSDLFGIGSTDDDELTWVIVSTRAIEGRRAFYVEVRGIADEAEICALMFVEESEGVLLSALLAAVNEQWQTLRDSAYACMNSIVWSPSRARTVIRQQPAP